MEDRNNINLLQDIRNCDTDQPFVFVSYSKKDRETVIPLIKKLQDHGANIWFDKELESSGGENWLTKIYTILLNENCKKILFMMSENSVTSLPVFKELLTAVKDESVIICHHRSIHITPVNVSAGYDISKSLTRWAGDIYKHVLRESLDLSLSDKGIIKDLVASGYIKDTASILIKTNPMRRPVQMLTSVFGSDLDMVTVVPMDYGKVLKNIGEEILNQNTCEKADVLNGSSQRNTNLIQKEQTGKNSVSCSVAQMELVLSNSDDLDLNHSLPVSIQIENKLLYRFSWRKIYSALVQELERKNPGQLEKFCLSKEMFKENSYERVACFASEKKDVFKNSTSEVIPGILINNNFSADGIINQMKKMCAKFGYETLENIKINYYCGSKEEISARKKEIINSYQDKEDIMDLFAIQESMGENLIDSDSAQKTWQRQYFQLSEQKNVKLINTFPVSISVDENEYLTDSWKQGYILLIRHFESLNPGVIKKFCENKECFNKSYRRMFAYEEEKEKAFKKHSTSEVVPGIYVDSNYSSDDMVKQMAKMCEKFNFNPELIKIEYVYVEGSSKKEINRKTKEAKEFIAQEKIREQQELSLIQEVSPAPESENNASLQEESTTSLSSIDPALVDLTVEKESFKNWLSSNSFSPNTQKTYFTAMNTLSNYLIDQGFLEENLFGQTDSETLKSLLSQLESNPEFIQWNKSSGPNKLTAFKKYISFRTDC